MTAALDAGAAAAFAQQVRDAVESGDPARMAAVFHPDAQVWENTTGVWQSLAHMQDFHADLAQSVPVTILDSRVTPTPEGYVEQHVKQFALPDGSHRLVASCIVVRLRDGRLWRAEEYLDSAQKPAGTSPA